MRKYHIVGRAGAGSLIAEFLFREVGLEFEISFPDLVEVKNPEFYAPNPLGRIPILICPDGTQIFEILAIVNHITTNFDGLAPPTATVAYDRYSQFRALFATSMYTDYRQHHTAYYIDAAADFDSLRAKAIAEQTILCDYIEVELAPYICESLLTAADFIFICGADGI